VLAAPDRAEKPAVERLSTELDSIEAVLDGLDGFEVGIQ
jgi:hypothetical protein